MRSLTLLAVLILTTPLFTPAYADTVQGFCERDGKRITFSDGIAFADARDSEGFLITAIYLTAKTLDRKALAACKECESAPVENTYPLTSLRSKTVENQRSATADGWIEMRHVGGELNRSSVVNLMYLSSDGVLTGLDGGNGQVTLQTNTPTHVFGTLTSEAREAPFSETDMKCEASFDLAVGWPKP